MKTRKRTNRTLIKITERIKTSSHRRQRGTITSRQRKHSATTCTKRRWLEVMEGGATVISKENSMKRLNAGHQHALTTACTGFHVQTITEQQIRWGYQKSTELIMACTHAVMQGRSQQPRSQHTRQRATEQKENVQHPNLKNGDENKRNHSETKENHGSITDNMRENNFRPKEAATTQQTITPKHVHHTRLKVRSNSQRVPLERLIGVHLVLCL